MLAELDDAAVLVEAAAVGEAASVVVDEIQRAEALDEAGHHELAGDGNDARPDVNSSKRSCWPHGGRQLSSWWNGRCHGMA